MQYLRYCNSCEEDYKIPGVLDEFVVMNESYMKNFEAFQQLDEVKDVMASTVLVPPKEFLTEFLKEMSIPVTMKSLFGKLYIQLSVEEIDKLLNWITEKRKMAN